ncbi:MAG TPA: hypothetical protein VL977_01385 [Solirubrobacteraceae bacterium]|nr:hypothetical protein [Solirubrobacteraceae bacterium]
MAAFEKVTIGFAGGSVLAARVAAGELEALAGALGGGSGWHVLNCEDGTVRLDLAQVAYVRVDSDEPRVGFGAA